MVGEVHEAPGMFGCGGETTSRADVDGKTRAGIIHIGSHTSYPDHRKRQLRGSWDEAAHSCLAWGGREAMIRASI